MNHPLTLLKSAFRPITEFIYPPTCFICESLMDGGENRVCTACWSSIRSVNQDDLLFREMHARLTSDSTSHVSDLISLYHFEKDGALQSIIHQLKYDGMTSLGHELGRKLGEKLMTEFPRPAIDGIVPVPLHATKLRERGYNQSNYIAMGIRERSEVPVFTSLLQRHKYTTSQTQLSAQERKENVGDAFELNKRYLLNLTGKTFLIVDDVITTGATIEACAQALMNKGASKVIACSVALADHSAHPLL